MSRLFICGPRESNPASIAAAFAGYGLEVAWHVLDGMSAPQVSAGLDEAVLVTAEAGVVTAGEALTRMAALLPPGAFITVCAPLSSNPQDRRLIHECGANSVVEPADWQLASVVERILGELILRGRVEPAGDGLLQGATQPIRWLYREIDTVAPLADPILILGETGAGKELVAREIHARSGRTSELLPINVAALSSELMASELFGHERGAFTGALERRTGLLAEAGNGTAFLDEIGDLDLHAQVHLLRVLEEYKVRPVGSNRWQPIRSRILFATNRDLDADCAAGRFRRDLYQRICGLRIHVPPLRKRKADLPLLVRIFLDAFNDENPGQRWMPPGALDPLFRYDWPGNVRELRQVVREAAAFASGPNGPINKERLRDAALSRVPRRWQQSASAAEPAPGSGNPPSTVAFDPETDTLQRVRDRAEGHYLRRVLALAGGNKALAAEKAGISLSQFYTLLKKGSADP
jgi:DNA-binding NtrC family response regulator